MSSDQLNCGGSPDEHTDDNSSTSTVYNMVIVMLYFVIYRYK